MNDPKTPAILIAGTGPVGLAAALALAGSGHGVSLVGPLPDADDRRTTALMLPALALLERFGLLAELEAAAAPLATMRIVDATKRLVRSPTVTFRAGEIGEPKFGLNLPNAALTAALAKAVRNRPGIAWHEGHVAMWRPGARSVVACLDDASEVAACLAVAADGRRSPARAAAGIRTRTHEYPQAALVLNFAHTRDHGFISTEFHTETGPCTQVPLPGRRSSLVWVVEPRMARMLADLDDASLSARVEERLGSFLGRVDVEPGRQVFPLSAALPERFAANRIALVGEAAHVLPPIGAQGLNLGLRDVADLAAIVDRHTGDPGAPEALKAYERMRRPDIVARSAAVDLVNRSLLSDLLPAQLARSAGLGLAGGLAPLRALFMREGLRPGSGLAALFGASEKEVGRQ